MARKKSVDENQIEMVVVEKQEGQAAELVIAPRVPAQAVKTKDPVSTFITQNMLDAGEQLLELEKSGGRLKRQIRTRVSFSYEGIDILARKEFNLFDQEVHDAVVSLWLAENQFISPAMVYRAMTGKTNSEFIHTKKLKEIEDSIDKCMFSKLSIDASEEAAAYGYEQAIYSGALLSAEKVSVKMGGKKVTAYRLLTEPLLYRYAKSCKQISAVDIKLLDTPVAKTNDTIVLQGYLLRKIESMKSDRYCERSIKYEDIYKALNITKEQRVQVGRIREYVKDILNFWIEKGYIKHFEMVMQGRSFKEIVIYF